MEFNQSNKKEVLDWIHDFNSKKEIILRITKFCNQKCLFCFTNIDNKTTFSFDILKEKVDNIIINNKWENLDFVITWGEPTLNKDLIKIIDYIYNKWFYITLQSNAVNFDKKLISKLKKYNNKLNFFISFHSHIWKIYDSITNSCWQFNNAVNWIKNLLLNFDNITINLVCNRFNKSTLKGYFNFIWKEFYSINKNINFNLSIMSNIYKYKYIDRLLINYSELISLINSCKAIINYYNINIGSDFWWPCDLPFCLWKKLFYYKEDIKSIRFEINKYIDREKIDKCLECKFINNCSGILKLYLEKYWEEEFNPIKKV